MSVGLGFDPTIRHLSANDHARIPSPQRVYRGTGQRFGEQLYIRGRRGRASDNHKAEDVAPLVPPRNCVVMCGCGVYGQTTQRGQCLLDRLLRND